MGRTSKRIALVVTLAVAILLATAAEALAYSTWSQTTYPSPGTSKREIVSKLDVATYAIPFNVTHIGYAHFELNFKPGWNDCDLYLLRSDGVLLGGVSGTSGEEGYLATAYGKEVVDYRIPSVSAAGRTLIDPDGIPNSGDEYLQGDVYYLVVVAFGGTTQNQVWGYVPQVDGFAGYGWNTTSPWNYWNQTFRLPGGKSWVTLNGCPYGGPYDFTPTSLGNCEFRLQWPANTTTHEVTYDPVAAPQPANWEQYDYVGADWNTFMEDYGDGNWGINLNPHTDGGTVWYGLLDDMLTNSDSILMAHHYVTSFYIMGSDPMQGPLAPPALGKSTMGFKATIFWPENLRMTAPSPVKKGSKIKISGSLAQADAWVPAGTDVTILKLVGSNWVEVKTTKTTGTEGKFSTSVVVNKTTKFRAAAFYTAGPPEAWGEQSKNKRVTVL